MPTPDHLKALAECYAPIFAHKVDEEWIAADQLAPIDFAGGLSDVARNLPAFFRLSRKKKATISNPKVYFSVVETGTHTSLIYAVYHIFDWWKRDNPTNLYDLIRDRLDEHAHDMEGALLVIRKRPENLLDGIITVSHRDFYLYSEPRRPIDKKTTEDVNGEQTLHIVKFRKEDIDGNVWIDHNTYRPKLFIQAKGHGMRGDHSGWGGGNYGEYYKEATVMKDPGALNSDNNNPVRIYQLEDIFKPDGLWEHRYRLGTFRQGANGRSQRPKPRWRNSY